MPNAKIQGGGSKFILNVKKQDGKGGGTTPDPLPPPHEPW